MSLIRKNAEIPSLSLVGHGCLASDREWTSCHPEKCLFSPTSGVTRGECDALVWELGVWGVGLMVGVISVHLVKPLEVGYERELVF